MRPHLVHYLSIAITAFTLIMMQVVLSRVFSVMFYYHFAFAGITLAMLGLTAGALHVHRYPERFTLSRLNEECARHGVSAALLLSAGILLLTDISGRLMKPLLSLPDTAQADSSFHALTLLAFATGALALLRAFRDGGVIITLLLTRFPQETHRLYAADLIAAALGALLVVLLLGWFDPIGLTLLTAFFMSFTANRLIVQAKETSIRKKRFYLGATILLGLLLVAQTLSSRTDNPLLRIHAAKGEILENLLFERWNSYSHVAVFPNREPQPFGWGYGTAYHAEDFPTVEQHLLRIDADAGTVLTRFDGNLDRLGFLQYDVINSGYHLHPVKSAAIIGIGGGRDILSALVFGAEKITAVEINPAIFEALNKHFADFTGHLSRFPQVHMTNAEARSYLNSQKETFDLIQISLIDTWAATAAGGLALSENKLYTTEAWREFLARLNPQGLLTVSRWFRANSHRGELYRMLSLAKAALHEINPALEPRNHVIALRGGDVATLLLSPSPFTAERLATMKQVADKYGFEILISPTHSFDETSAILLSEHADKAFMDSLPLRADAPTDDRPFFFNMQRFKAQWQSITETFNHQNNQASNLLLILLLSVLAVMAYTLLWPMWRLYCQQKKMLAPEKSGSTLPYILYFAGIGLGFMLVEMALMQRLMIFLGHPVYSLSVILFTLLLFSGIGSYAIKPSRLTPRQCIQLPALLCLLLVITGTALPAVMEHFAHLPVSGRMMLAVMALVPVSFFMGMMFPLGVHLGEIRKAALLPWFWAINGVASVVASVAAIILSMQFGIQFTYLSGIGCYALCLLMVVILKPYRLMGQGSPS
jgi:hypothetical protein